MKPSQLGSNDKPEHGGATLANWRAAPFNEYAFQHVREFVASVDIPNDAKFICELPYSVSELREPPLDAYLKATKADGLLVVHCGKIVLERYCNGMAASTPHILMSVSKSVLGLLVGILANQKLMQTEALVTKFVPELSNTAYAGATVQHLLDMRAGVSFNEDYLATSGPMIAYRKATNWNPLSPGEVPSDLASFFKSLKAPDGNHGGRLHYISPNTDLLGWVVERATGKRYWELVSNLLWKPIGAEVPAYITVDSRGAPRSAGGMCVTLRDLGRLGQMIASGGMCRDRVVVPQAWLEDMGREGDCEAWRSGSLTAYFPGQMRYRSQWYVSGDDQPVLFAFGIHGQYLFVDQKRQIVVAQLSCQERPLDSAQIALTLDVINGITRALSERK